MSDATLAHAAPVAGPIQRASMDMLRSVLMGAATPLLAHGFLSNDALSAIVGGSVAVASAVWSYAAAHPSKVSPFATVLAWVRAGRQGGAWDGDLAKLEPLLLPIVEKLVDDQIKVRAGVAAGPLDEAANAALRTEAGKIEAAAKVPLG
ncbi:MAG: hypothetical protein JO111_11740 [Caulobacteraceae bacterium]|nr:hypothetical protein [Caulobacteraceae bacterium]